MRTSVAVKLWSTCSFSYTALPGPLPMVPSWLHSRHIHPPKLADPTQAPHSSWDVPSGWHVFWWRRTDGTDEEGHRCAVSGLNLCSRGWLGGRCWTLVSVTLRVRRTCGMVPYITVPQPSQLQNWESGQTMIKALSRIGGIQITQRFQLNRNNWGHGSHETWKKIKLT